MWGRDEESIGEGVLHLHSPSLLTAQLLAGGGVALSDQWVQYKVLLHSYPVLSCPILSYPSLSYHVLSGPDLICPGNFICISMPALYSE